MGLLKFGRQTVETSNEDKVFFPQDKITKGDLIEYYHQVADTLLPYVKGRPLVMKRYPDGIKGEAFFQKEAGDYFPDWIKKVTVKKEGGTVRHVLCDNAATLLYLGRSANADDRRGLLPRDLFGHRTHDHFLHFHRPLPRLRCFASCFILACAKPAASKRTLHVLIGPDI